MRPLGHYPFSVAISVRITDLNYGGHLGNDRLLALVQEARIAFLARFGFSELDCGGVSLIMGDAAVVFQAEAYAGDLLKVEVAAAEPSGSGFRLFYRMTKVPDGKAVALVETGMVCFDYSSRKIQALPASVKDICLAERGES